MGKKHMPTVIHADLFYLLDVILCVLTYNIIIYDIMLYTSLTLVEIFNQDSTL